MNIENQESLHFLDYWRVIQSRKEIVISMFLMIVITGVIITFTMSKIYKSSVVITVKEDSPDVDVFSRDIMRFDPLFLRTQFELIQSTPIIEEVVRRLNLTDKLAKFYSYDMLSSEKQFKRTVAMLSDRMNVKQYRDTNLIEIQVSLRELGSKVETANVLAADIADMIAIVYRDESMRRARQSRERALKALYETLDEHNKSVSAAEKKVEQIRDKYQINIAPFGEKSSLDNVALARLEAKRIEVRMELEEKKSKYEKISSLSSKKVLAAIPFMVGDPVLAELMSEKVKAEVEMSKLLKASLGPKHPDVVRLKAVISELEKKINNAVDGLKIGMQADYEASKGKFLALEMMIESRKAKERVQEGGGYREFNNAVNELKHVKKIRNVLELRHMQEQIEMRIPRTIVEIVEPAKPADLDDQVSPNYVLNIILSIIVGICSGIGLAFFIEYMDTSVKTIEDVEHYMNASVLGVIPQKVKPFIDETADTAHAEAYRVLRTNIQFSKNLKNAKTICVTSGSVGEGKSLTLFNLSYICAQLGDKVLLIDSDLHRPRQHKILGVSNSIGLANILVGEVRLEDSIIATDVFNLDFLPSGKLESGVHGLLDTRRMKDLIAQIRESYDIIYFDAPPMIGVSDASLLVREMDGVLLVVQHRKYPRAISGRAKEMVDNVGGNLIGVVLNNINISRDQSYYYYHQHYYSYPQKTFTTKTV